MSRPPQIVLMVDGTELTGHVVLHPGGGEFYGELPEEWAEMLIPDGPREITLSFKAFVDYQIGSRLTLRWRNA